MTLIKQRSQGRLQLAINPRNTSRTNAHDDGSSNSQDCHAEVTDHMRKGKRKPVTTNFNTNKKVVRDTGESHPLAEDKLSLYGGSDLDEQTDWCEPPKVQRLFL